MRALRSPRRPLWVTLSLACTLSGALGCAAQAPPPRLADDPELQVHRSGAIELRTDLQDTDAQAFLVRLEAIEDALDHMLPSLSRDASAGVAPVGSQAGVVTLVLSNPARFALYSKDRKVDPQAGAFVTSAGELVYRFRAQDWAEGPPYPTEARSRALAGASLRRRLILRLGPGLKAGWLEEGLVAAFAEVIAREFGEEVQPTRLRRQRLLDAFLPLYLGGPPVLERMFAARGRPEMERAGGSASLAWAAARFLLADPQQADLIRQVLEHARPDPDEAAWERTRVALAGLERPFERSLSDQCVAGLLAAVRDEAHAVDRWEAAAALRVVANLELDPDLSARARAQQVRASGPLLEKHPPDVRFLDRYRGRLLEVRGSRSRMAAMRKLRKQIRREFTRRTEGYGHPAIEKARDSLGKALQRAYESL